MADAIETAELDGAEISDNLDRENEGFEFEPLFDESVTEAELTGEVTEEEGAETSAATDDPDKKAEKTDEEKAAEEAAEKTAKEEAEKAAKEDGKKAEDPDDKKPDEASEIIAKKEKHIAGLNTAVTQERQTVAKLKQENQRLAAELSTSKTSEPNKDETEKWKDFKVLSDEEYSNLVDEDPDEASKYLYRHSSWLTYQKGVSDRQQSVHQSQAAQREIINEGMRALEEVLPGLSAGKNEMADKLTDFAVENGLDSTVLQVLTDPRTMITTNEGENLLIGDGAAQLVKLIKSTFEATANTPDEASVREKIEAEIRPKIEAELQEKIIAKLKLDPSSGFRSLDEVSGSGKEDFSHTGTVSEGDYARMSETEREAHLGA